jgi:hypothetical protein
MMSEFFVDVILKACNGIAWPLPFTSTVCYVDRQSNE